MFKHRAVFILFLAVLVACTPGAPNFPVVNPSSTLSAPAPVLTQTVTASPPTLTPVPMAITVNKDGITVEEFKAELARYKAAQKSAGNEVTDENAVQAVQNDLIAQLLLAQGAAEAGFVLDDAGLQARKEKLISSVGADKFSSWLQEHGYTETDFDESLKRAASAAWMRDKIMSSVPVTAEQVHVRQILLYNEDVAQKYYDQLKAGADFDELATRVDPAARGDIGWFPRGYLTEKAVEDAAFSLEVGSYSAIIPGEAGFHILKVLDRQSERGLSPDALFILQNRALEDWLATRRQQSNIVLAP